MKNFPAAMAWLVGCAMALCLGPACASALGAADVTVFAPGRRLLYDVDIGATVNEAGRDDGEVGLRLSAQLAVAVLWPPASAAPPHDEFLLHFEVRAPCHTSYLFNGSDGYHEPTLFWS